MPILEICQLKIKPHLSQHDPSLLAALQQARTRLREKVVDTRSRFYRCIDEPSLVYILGFWPSLERHKQFLSSSHKAEILDEQDKLFDFQWIIHTDIADVDAVPLDSPVLGIGRFFIEKGGVEAYKKAVTIGEVNAEDLKASKAIAQWRIDCEEGKFEEVMITGWKNAQLEYPEYQTLRNIFDEMDVKYAKDMEKGKEDNKL